MKEALDRNILKIASSTTLPNSDKQAFFAIVGDEAFPLMKPFPGRDLNDEKTIYNYCLSRARRTSENAFGIPAARFQIFKRPICTTPSNVKDIVFASSVLHNYFRAHSRKTYSPPELIDREDVARG